MSRLCQHVSTWFAHDRNNTTRHWAHFAAKTIVGIWLHLDFIKPILYGEHCKAAHATTRNCDGCTGPVDASTVVTKKSQISLWMNSVWKSYWKTKWCIDAKRLNPKCSAPCLLTRTNFHHSSWQTCKILSSKWSEKIDDESLRQWFPQVVADKAVPTTYKLRWPR